MIIFDLKALENKKDRTRVCSISFSRKTGKICIRFIASAEQSGKLRLIARLTGLTTERDTRHKLALLHIVQRKPIAYHEPFTNAIPAMKNRSGTHKREYQKSIKWKRCIEKSINSYSYTLQLTVFLNAPFTWWILETHHFTWSIFHYNDRIVGWPIADYRGGIL